MSGYASYAVRDQNGNIIGYSTQPGQIGTTSQNYSNILNAYNAQHFATVGSSPTTYNPQYNVSLNPGSYANTALGIGQQVLRSGGEINPFLKDKIYTNYGVDRSSLQVSGNKNFGSERNNQLAISRLPKPFLSPSRRAPTTPTPTGLPPGVAFTGAIKKANISPASEVLSGGNQTRNNRSAISNVPGMIGLTARLQPTGDSTSGTSGRTQSPPSSSSTRSQSGLFEDLLGGILGWGRGVITGRGTTTGTTTTGTTAGITTNTGTLPGVRFTGTIQRVIPGSTTTTQASSWNPIEGWTGSTTRRVTTEPSGGEIFGRRLPLVSDILGFFTPGKKTIGTTIKYPNQTSESTVITPWEPRTFRNVTPNDQGGYDTLETTIFGQTVNTTRTDRSNQQTKTVIVPTKSPWETATSSLLGGWQKATDPLTYEKAVGSIFDPMVIGMQNLQRHPGSELKNLGILGMVNAPRIATAALPVPGARFLGEEISKKADTLLSPLNYDRMSEAETKQAMKLLPSEAVSIYFTPAGETKKITRDGIYKGEYKYEGVRPYLDLSTPLNVVQDIGSRFPKKGRSENYTIGDLNPLYLQTDKEMFAKQAAIKANPKVQFSEVLPYKMELGSVAKGLWDLPHEDPFGALMYYSMPIGFGGAENLLAMGATRSPTIARVAGSTVTRNVAKGVMDLVMGTMVADTALKVPGYQTDPIGFALGVLPNKEETTGTTKLKKVPELTKDPLGFIFGQVPKLVKRTVTGYDEITGEPIYTSQTPQAAGKRGGESLGELGLMYLGGLANEQIAWKAIHQTPQVKASAMDRLHGKLADVFDIAFSPDTIGDVEARSILKKPVHTTDIGQTNAVPARQRIPDELIPEFGIVNRHGELVVKGIQGATGIPVEENPKITVQGLSATFRDKLNQIDMILKTGKRGGADFDPHNLDIGKNVYNARSILSEIRADLNEKIRYNEISAAEARPIQKALTKYENYLDNELLPSTITVRESPHGRLIQQSVRDEYTRYANQVENYFRNTPLVVQGQASPAADPLSLNPYEIIGLGSAFTAPMGTTYLKPVGKDVDVTVQNPMSAPRSIAEGLMPLARERMNRANLQGLTPKTEVEYPTQWVDELLGIRSRTKTDVPGQVNTVLTSIFGEANPEKFNIRFSASGVDTHGMKINKADLGMLSAEDLGLDFKIKTTISPRSDTGSLLPYWGFVREIPSQAEVPFVGLGTALFGNPNISKIKTEEYTQVTVNPREMSETQEIGEILGMTPAPRIRSPSTPASIRGFLTSGAGIGDAIFGGGKTISSKSPQKSKKIELPTGFGKYPKSAFEGEKSGAKLIKPVSVSSLWGSDSTTKSGAKPIKPVSVSSLWGSDKGTTGSGTKPASKAIKPSSISSILGLSSMRSVSSRSSRSSEISLPSSLSSISSRSSLISSPSISSVSSRSSLSSSSPSSSSSSSSSSPSSSSSSSSSSPSSSSSSSSSSPSSSSRSSSGYGSSSSSSSGSSSSGSSSSGSSSSTSTTSTSTTTTKTPPAGDVGEDVSGGGWTAYRKRRHLEVAPGAMPEEVSDILFGSGGSVKPKKKSVFATATAIPLKTKKSETEEIMGLFNSRRVDEAVGYIRGKYTKKKKRGKKVSGKKVMSKKVTKNPISPKLDLITGDIAYSMGLRATKSKKEGYNKEKTQSIYI